MQNKSNKGRGLTLLLIAAMLVMMIAMFQQSRVSTEKYSAVIKQFQTQQVSEFELNLGSGKLTYRLRTDTASTLTHNYTVPNVDLFLLDVRDSVQEYNDAHPSEPIVYNYVAASNWGTIIINFLPVVLLIGAVVAFYFMMSQQTGGRVGSIGKAKTHGSQDEERKATFVDVAGADEEKEELLEIVEYLKNPARFRALGAKIPRGVLLVGPPGTGKTLLARAVAGEAGVPFYSISGSDFVELYVGVGASRVRDLFEKAKKTRPSIIFIDEIDAVGRQRGTGLGGGHDEREQTLNQLLVEMDGFTGNEGVIVMAATNRADVLDPALLRPGRFDRRVYVGVPDVKGREEILKVHARNKPLGPDVDLNTIAKSTPGFTGADLENLLNEAALLAARANQKAVTEKNIEEARLKVEMGPEKKSKRVTDEDRRLAAYHEAGHAIATFYATPEQSVHYITIIPRGMAGGFTMSLPVDDKEFRTKRSMENEIVTLLGGRVAEQLVFEDISTGASSDLERATQIAHLMVTKYGFSKRLGPVVYGDHNEVFLGRDFTQSRNYSDQVANEIDTEIRTIIEECYKTCKKILSEHMDKLKAVAEKLLTEEKIESFEFKGIMGVITKDSAPSELAAEKPQTEQAPAPEVKADEQTEVKPKRTSRLRKPKDAPKDE